MPITITMPALSPTMTEGTLAKWHVKEGDQVSPGDVLAEIETDKATMEVEAIDDGVVGRLLVGEGTEAVAVNAPIAVLLEEGEDQAALEDYQPKGAAAPAQAEKAPEPPRPAAKPQPAAKAPAQRPAQGPAETSESFEGYGAAGQELKEEDRGAKAPPAPKDANGNRLFASPLARRMAAQAGIDLTAMQGSGPHGRIVKSDVEKALRTGVGAPARKAPEAAPPAAKAPPQPGAPQPFEPEYELQPLSAMRKTIARRMTESKQTVPHFYLTVDCEIDALLKLREDLNSRAGGAYKLSVNDMLIKAAALALMRVPAANVGYSEQGVKRYKTADVSIAVATERGLITPVIRRAEQKGLATISKEMRELGLKARDGKLMPEEYQGGSFSLSNLGMYGVKQFEAVINPPQACILAVGAGEQRAVVKDGALAIATMMSCTLSVDHRAADGAIGAEYLKAFKKLIEDPIAMML